MLLKQQFGGKRNSIKRKTNFTVAAVFSAVLALTAGVTAKTEHWNDASASKGEVTSTYLGGDTAWEDWKTGWNSIKTNYEQVAITLGWYSKTKSNDAGEAKARISEHSDMLRVKEYTGSCKPGTVIGGEQYYTNKVTVSGLEPDRTYYYSVMLNGAWQPAQEMKTGDETKFSFLYVGDPQIGASVGQVPVEGNSEQTADFAARNDAYQWNKVLNQAFTAFPDLDFILSAGDQVNEYVKNGSAEKLLQQKSEYAGFLSPQHLRSVPIATTIGNHDSRTVGYQNHYNNPNPFLEETSPTKAGNGYYFSYQNALMIFLNLNNYNCADHAALIDKAVAEYPNAKWRIVTVHQDLYGSGLDHSDSDGIILRTQLTPIFDKYDIDVVLQGHDHTYSRTYQLSGDGKTHTAYDNSIDLDNETSSSLIPLTVPTWQ